MSDEIVAAFLRKIGTGRINEVRAMLAATPQLVNAVGPHPFWGGRPQALHVAIETRRRDMFDLLLEAGADVNGSNEQYDHWSPLMIAVKESDMRDELLRRGGGPRRLARSPDARTRDEQYDSTSRGWAETSSHVSGNPKCARVVAYLETITTEGGS